MSTIAYPQTVGGGTTNTGDVLLLVLALPADYALVPAAVVTQTLVELVGMVVLTRLVASRV